MSFREIREQIIAENVPELIKSLMGITVSSFCLFPRDQQIHVALVTGI